MGNMDSKGSKKITGSVAKVSKDVKNVASKPVKPVVASAPASRVQGMSRAKAKLLGASLGALSLVVAGGFVLLSSAADGPAKRTAGVAGKVTPAATAAVAAKNGAKGASSVKARSGARSSALALKAPGAGDSASAADKSLAADADVSDFAGTAGRSAAKHGKGAQGQDGADAGRSDAAKLGKGERRPATSEEISRIRTMLQSPEAKDRLAALRLARTLDAPEIAADVRALLGTEKNTPVKRVGVQVLALGDPSQNMDIFKSMRSDPDAVVRVNSAFGMARGGDDAQAAWLLKVYDASRVVAPRLVPVLGAALEDPTIKSPAIVARYQQIASNPKLSADLRARAAQVVQSKQGG